MFSVRILDCSSSAQVDVGEGGYRASDCRAIKLASPGKDETPIWTDVTDDEPLFPNLRKGRVADYSAVGQLRPGWF